MEKFKSSYSNGMLLSTCILMILIIYAIYTIAIQLVKFPVDSLRFIGAGLALCFVVVTLLYAFMSQIEYVYFTERSIIIKKKVGKIILPLDTILQVCYKKSLVSDIRLWGISGLFGHIGLFWSKKTGKYRAHVKDGSSMLEIRTIDKSYVISCDDYKQVLDILHKFRGEELSALDVNRHIGL